MKRATNGNNKLTLGFIIGIIFNLLLFKAATAAVVDVMIVYDTTAATWAADNGGIDAFSLDAVNRMNQALENSELDHSFRLVHSMTVEYQTDSLDPDLTALQEGTGVFADVHIARDEYGADLVALMVDTGSPYGTVGMGYQLSTLAGDVNSAFTVNAIQSVAISHTFTHEIGHNLGAAHAKSQSSYPGPNSFLSDDGSYDFSAGWYFTGTNDISYHTIMAYSNDGSTTYQEAPLFSSPLVTYQGTPAGDAVDGDNARLLDETFVVVADYKDDSRTATPVNTLTGLTINGPDSVGENDTATYTATASWSDGSANVVTPSWDEDSEYAEFSASGVLTTGSVSSDQPVTVRASYSAGDETVEDSQTVTITDVPETATTLTGLNISGPDSVGENDTATYTATANWSDGSSDQVNPAWSENSEFASIDAAGVLQISSIPSNQQVTVEATYTTGEISRTASQTVELIVFNTLGEAVDNNSLALTTEGDADWFEQEPVAHSAPAALESGDIDDYRHSVLETIVSGPGTISFYWKVSSEEGYDFLRFLVDDAAVTEIQAISGDVDWQKQSVTLPAGQHTLTWEYSKDDALSVGSDCGWLDQLVWKSAEERKSGEEKEFPWSLFYSVFVK